MRIIVILLSLMTLALGGCQGNRLNGSTAAPVAPAKNRRICRFNAIGASDIGQSRQKSLNRV